MDPRRLTNLRSAFLFDVDWLSLRQGIFSSWWAASTDEWCAWSWTCFTHCSFQSAFILENYVFHNILKYGTIRRKPEVKKVNFLHIPPSCEAWKVYMAWGKGRRTYFPAKRDFVIITNFSVDIWRTLVVNHRCGFFIIIIATTVGDRRFVPEFTGFQGVNVCCCFAGSDEFLKWKGLTQITGCKNEFFGQKLDPAIVDPRWTFPVRADFTIVMLNYIDLQVDLNCPLYYNDSYWLITA